MVTFTTTSRSVRQELERDTSLKVQPLDIDIAMLPAVQSMLESALNSDISQDNLEKKLLRVLPRAIRKWSSDAVQELEQVALEQLCLPPSSKPSNLPWVIFRCKARSRSCRQRLKFDEALSHDHLYREKREEEGKDKREKTDEISAYDTFIMGFSLRPRNIQGLQIDVTASRRVENLVRRMGQNPSRVTYDELRRSTVEVVCGLCNPKDSMRMNFEDAVCIRLILSPLPTFASCSFNTVLALISGRKKQKCGAAPLRGNRNAAKSRQQMFKCPSIMEKVVAGSSFHYAIRIYKLIRTEYWMK